MGVERQYSREAPNPHLSVLRLNLSRHLHPSVGGQLANVEGATCRPPGPILPYSGHYGTFNKLPDTDRR